jgi:adenylate cyclase
MSPRGPLTAAERAGVTPEFLDRLLALGIVSAADSSAVTATDIRRVRVVEALHDAGLPLEALATALRDGDLSLDFVAQPAYDRFAAHVETTLGEVAAEGRVPLDLLVAMRAAMGVAEASEDDRVRETELPVIGALERLLAFGVRPGVLARALRVYADSLRRVAETEADWWASDLLAPLYRSGMPPAEVDRRSAQFTSELSDTGEELVLALFRAQQASAWMRNILEGFEGVLVRRGRYEPPERPPAICFLDLSGFTRLTDERGDRAALDLARALGDLVQRSSVRHGGRAVKWLGDGVMFHFPQPGSAVVASLEMVDAARDAGLPPAHVGIHAGPVLYRDGDYFGRTVNAAARIADYARRGEVLVSQEVVDAGHAPGVEYEEIGPVDLKGLAHLLTLSRARRVDEEHVVE